MLDWINAFIQAFSSFVTMLFSLPLYGSLTWGYALLAIYVSALVLMILGGRFK